MRTVFAAMLCAATLLVGCMAHYVLSPVQHILYQALNRGDLITVHLKDGTVRDVSYQGVSETALATNHGESPLADIAEVTYRDSDRRAIEALSRLGSLPMCCVSP